VTVLLVLLMPAIVASTDSMTVRNAHALVYDTHRGVVLLIAGADERQVLGDLWQWDGDQWKCLSAAALPPRTFPSAVYDERRRRVVVFGGNRVLFGTTGDSNTFLNDHWEWTGTAWEQFPGPTPPARAEAAMVYDRKRDRTVLFGGYRVQNGQRERFGDLWEFDGTRWTEVKSDGPDPRNGAAMTYDIDRNVSILYGGSGLKTDTWQWNGHSWSTIAGDNTIGRFNSVMAFDASRKMVLRFGGWNGSGRTAETWILRDDKWTPVQVDGPAARNHAGMVFDARRNAVVLVVGHDGDNIFGDVWEWDGQRWTCVRNYPARLRIDNGH
jgi:hypothetical protein